MTNKELIEKADVTMDAFSGVLNAEQAKEFKDFIVDETSLKDKVRVVFFGPTQHYIDKMDIASRVAVPKSEAVDPGIRRGVSTSRITLEHRELVVPIEISYSVFEENIEGEALESRIIRMMAARFANNIEQMLWEGNATVAPAILESSLYEGGSTSLYVKDSLMGLMSGYLKLAESGHVIDAAGETIKPSIISRAINTMPNKFRKNRGLLKFLLSPDHEQAYREQVSTRVGVHGDNALSGLGNIPAFGVEMIPVGLLDSSPTYAENTVANTDGTTATALSYAPMSGLVLTPTTLDAIPTAKYVLATDYSKNDTAGTWTRLGGGIGSGATIKATYSTAGKIILTDPKNLIFAIGRDIRIEQDKNIFKGVRRYAITAKVWAAIEETDAVVMIKNVAVPS